jgi:DNA primase large subunit
MDYISYQDKAEAIIELHKEAIEDKLEDVINRVEEIGNLLNRVEDEELVDEINYQLSKIIGIIDEI